MGYKEHIKDETRTTEDFLKIKLHKEGNFWRAYEWSAYLSRLFPSDLNEIDRLKPLKKSLKGNKGEYVFVGLQMKSLDKYFPNVSNNKLFEIHNDNTLVIYAEQFFKKEDFSNYVDILNEWKIALTFLKKKKRKTKMLYLKIILIFR